MDLKNINYRGGYASFKIPKHWTVGVGKEGEINAYDKKSDDIFSLNFSIITVAPPPEKKLKNPTVHEFLKIYKTPANTFKVVINEKNILLKHHDVEKIEGVKYLTYYFEYIHENKKGLYDLAVFNWSIEEKLKDAPAYVAYLKMIEESAMNLKFRN